MKPDLIGLPKGYQRPNKPFIVAEIRRLEDQVSLGQISHGRFVEILNEMAINWHNSNKAMEEKQMHSEEEIIDFAIHVRKLCIRYGSRSLKSVKKLYSDYKKNG